MLDRHLLPADQWAEAEFGTAYLGDERRTTRLVQMATKLAETPNGNLPETFSTWAELKAAYRAMDSPHASYAAIQGPHWERSQAECRQPGEYLVIEDTTDLDYSGHPSARRLGVIGDGRGRGFRLHSSLAVRVEGWSARQRPQGRIVGLVAQQCYCPRPAPAGETRSQRYHRARQSQRWARELLALGRCPPACRWIYIADRESDIYEPVEQCAEQGLDYIIRSCQDRRLDQAEAQHLRAAIAQAPVLGYETVALRARPGQPARTAKVAVRHQRLDLVGPYRPGGRRPGFSAHVVEVREVEPPAAVAEPLHWVLLTSLDCATWEQVRRVVGRYATRELIEEYHKAIKSGTRVEDSQEQHRYRLESLIAILTLVAVRLLNTKLLVRSQPDAPIQAGEFGPEALLILSAHYGKPAGGWTHLSVFVAIARLGGFLARKGDGLPGWQTIWRGWRRLMTMCEGLEILNIMDRKYG